jgi:hypothetical protein
MFSAADAVRKLVDRYEREMYTRLEVLSLFVEAASSVRAMDLAETMPADWLEDVQATTVTPPLCIDDVIHISGAIRREPCDYDSLDAEMRRRWFEGAWNWHRFFCPEK